GGVDDAVDKLKEGIELPLKNPDAFARLGIRPAKGFLLYGPPGTGKTLLAKAVAKEAEANFISMKSSDLLSKWYGESEQQIARLFQRARAVAPCVLFIDEIDSLVPARGSGQGEPQVTGRVVNTILAEMDGLEEMRSVVVIGATNRPALVDPALLRPGRFDELVYVGTPDRKGREQILGIHTQHMPLADDVSLSDLADKTERYTGADLEDVVRRAGLNALRRAGGAVETVTAADFVGALDDSRATVTEAMENEYKNMRGELKKRAAEVHPIGFIHEGMVEPARARKHGKNEA
ncbi:MAG: AAA family ATPase, partial [Erythrobacter sp. 34-65-8]